MVLMIGLKKKKYFKVAYLQSDGLGHILVSSLLIGIGLLKLLQPQITLCCNLK